MIIMPEKETILLYVPILPILCHTLYNIQLPTYIEEDENIKIKVANI